MYKRFSIFIAAVFFVLHLQGQKFSPAASQRAEWKLLEIATGINTAIRHEYAYAFEKSVLYISENEATVSVWHDAFGFGLIRIDNEGKVKWKSPVPGYIIGSAKWKENVIVFYTKEWDYKEYGSSPVTEVFAVVFDIQAGKKLKEKVVFQNEGKKFVQPIVLVKPDGQFGQLLIRQTNNSGKKADDRFKTAALTVVSLGESLETVFSKPIQTAALKGSFLGSEMNAKNETFITTRSGNNIIVEKFDSNFAPSGKLESNGDYESPGIALRLNSQNDQSLLVGVREWKRNGVELALYDFDFKAGKAIASHQLLDKERSKEWKAQNKEQGFKPADFKDLSNLRLANLLQTGDKIIAVLQEWYFRVDGNGKFAGHTIGPALIAFFDRKLNLVGSQAIQKEYDVDNQYLMDWTIGANIYAGKLLLVSNDGVKQRTASVILSAVDLATMKTEQVFYLEKEGTTTEGAATLWFGKNFIITSGHEKVYRWIGF